MSEESQGLVPLVARLARVGGWSLDTATGRLDWSEAINKVIEFQSGGRPGLEAVLDTFPEPDRSLLVEALDACRTQGQPFDLDLRAFTSSGREVRVRAVGEARRDEHGAIVELRGAVQDVTDSYRLATAARTLARRLETTLESMSDAVFILDEGWNFIYLNRRSEELLLRSRAELLGRNIWAEFPPSVGSEFDRAYHRAVASGETQSFVAHYPPLDTWFDVTAYPTPDGLAVYFRDVNDLVATQRELQRRQAMIDRAGDAILVRTLDSVLIEWNGGAERMYGWSPAEAIGRNARDLLYDDPRPFDLATKLLLADGSWSGELEQRRRDGSRLTVAARWTLIHDDRGEPEFVLAINSDITERRRIEAELYRAQRLDSVGRLASGIAHDLNNVLAPIMMASDLLAARITDRELGELVESVRQSAERGSDMVRRVLTFASGVDSSRRPVDVDELVDDVAGIVAATFPRSIALVVANDAPGSAVLGDRTQLHQVLLNLCVNARDALVDGGRLTIRVSREEIDEQYASHHPNATAGSFVTVTIEDTGTGMRPEVLDRATEPFFTTKPQGEGTGLGLSIARSIAHGHGGFLRLTSTYGVGTRADVVLPSTSEPPLPDVPRRHSLPRGRGETVLLVDDEPLVLDITRRTLESLGYRIVTAGNGADAVKAFVADASVSVVVTDMTMPIMDGAATARVLRTIRPDVRIIVVTGVATDEPLAVSVRDQAQAFLTKPFTAAQLAEALATVLEHPTR